MTLKRIMVLISKGSFARVIETMAVATSQDKKLSEY